VKTQFLSSGSVRTAFQISGNGPALLLLHGAEANRLSFNALSAHLIDHFTLITYDQRDCGETESGDQSATIEELADDAHVLLKHLGFSRAHVFGSSYGGRVAQALAMRHPEIIGKLILGSTWPLPQQLKELNPEVLLKIQNLRNELPESAASLASLYFTADFLQNHTEFQQIFANVQTENPRTIRRHTAVDSTMNIDWSLINMPVLLLTGADDQIVPPANSINMASQIKNSKLIVMPKTAHATVIESPEKVAMHLIHFLTAP
jgi:pimeloyl-ACP methyl ester carboxylesterase